MKVSPEILELVPYKPGKPIGETQREYGLTEVIKLGSNENNLGVSPKVIQAVTEALTQQFRYPDPTCYQLIQTLTELWQIPSSHLGIGNGSNELIDLLVRIFCAPGDAILTHDKAFLAYQICAQAARVQTLVAPFKKESPQNFQVDLPAMAQILRDDLSHRIKLIFLPNPNNPTGSILPPADLRVFLAEFGHDSERLIVFDEAYTEYVRSPEYVSALQLRQEFSNIVVLRTLSKAYGLAGFRIGILVASPQVIDYFNRVRNPFNVNDLAQVAAIAALQDKEFLRASVEMVWSGLDYLSPKLAELGLQVTPSEGNFVLFETHRDLQKLYPALLRRGVILRPVGNYGLPTHLRMSVGKPLENQKAIAALSQVLQEIPSGGV